MLYVYSESVSNCMIIDNLANSNFAECLCQNMLLCNVIFLTDNLDNDGDRIPVLIQNYWKLMRTLFDIRQLKTK